MNDVVNNPSHYTDGKIEVIDFIEDKKLNFHRGNAVKYISRAGKKDPSKEIEDLKKAAWYINREIQSKEDTLFKDDKYGKGYNDGFEDGKEQAYIDCYDKTREETAKEIFTSLMRELNELEQYYMRLNILHIEINLTTTNAAKKIVRRVLSNYGVADISEREIINLRLGITQKDFEIITTALREYGKNHPNPKCHANEAKDLADMIERQGQEVEE